MTGHARSHEYKPNGLMNRRESSSTGTTPKMRSNLNPCCIPFKEEGHAMRNVHTTKTGKPEYIVERCRQPDAFIDGTDTGRCAINWRKYDMMMAEAELCYPAIPKGMNSWVLF